LQVKYALSGGCHPGRGLDCAPVQITGGSNPPQAVCNKNCNNRSACMPETKYDARLARLLDRTEIFDLVARFNQFERI
jgi:hypothetical protein